MELEELKKKLKETEEGLTSTLEEVERLKKEKEEIEKEKETLSQEKTKLTLKVEELTTSETGLKVELEKTKSDYRELLNQKSSNREVEDKKEELKLYENLNQIMTDILG